MSRGENPAECAISKSADNGEVTSLPYSPARHDILRTEAAGWSDRGPYVEYWGTTDGAPWRVQLRRPR